MPSDKTIGRLSLYRRLLRGLQTQGTEHIFSHELGEAAGVTAAQVRRDIMALGYSGSPFRGYNVRELVASIGSVLDTPGKQPVVLLGVGNLGRAILAYFANRHPKLAIVAAFDKDPSKAGRVTHGCRTYRMEDLGNVVEQEQIRVGILTVPAEVAQEAAEALVGSGVKGILNFAPVPLRVPPDVYVEAMDMTMSLEKVAYFARCGREVKGEVSEESNVTGPDSVSDAGMV